MDGVLLSPNAQDRGEMIAPVPEGPTFAQAALPGLHAVEEAAALAIEIVQVGRREEQRECHRPLDVETRLEHLRQVPDREVSR
jgi:hypothetical protein